MPEPIATLPSVGAAPTPEEIAEQARAAATSEADSLGGAFGQDRELFLKLLVAQLRYQDPTNPAKPQEFMAQTAQFTMVDNLMQISSRLADAAVTDRIGAASSLVGRTVTFEDGLTGTVEAVRFTSGLLQVVLTDGTTLPADAITEIATGQGAAPATGTPDHSHEGDHTHEAGHTHQAPVGVPADGSPAGRPDIT